MTDNFQIAHHPDADELSAFAEGVLTPQEREQTLAHLAECARCREVVALAFPAEAAVEPMPVSEGGVARWFRGWRLAFPAAAVLGATVLIVVSGHRTPVVDPPAQVAEERPVPAPLPAGDVGAGPVVTPALPQVPSARTNRARPPQPPLPSPLQSYSVNIAENQSVSNLPLQNRSTQNFAGGTLGGPRQQQNMTLNQLAQSAPAAAPAASGQVHGYAFNLPAPAPQVASGSANGGLGLGAGAGVAAQQSTVEVAASAADIATEDGVVTSGVKREARVLPSGLAVASMVTRGSRTLAIDTAGGLFASDDGGSVWKAVSTPWKGRALRLERASFVAGQEVGDKILSAEARVRSAPTSSAAQLTGVVRDAAGAVIPGAAVSLTLADGSRVTTESDSAGRYALPVGQGSLEVSAPGFARQIISLQPREASSSVQDVTLSVGQVSETVTVESDTRAMPKLRALKKAPAVQPFEVITDVGERWTSADGVHWKALR